MSRYYTMLELLVCQCQPDQELRISAPGPGRLEVAIGHRIVLGGDKAIVISSLVADAIEPVNPSQLVHSAILPPDLD